MAVVSEDRRFQFTAAPVDALAPEIGRVLKPIGEAHGLPNRLYTDAELFASDRDRLMAQTWACIGFVSDLPTTGYAWPVDFMDLPLLVLRNKRGEVNVFHNVCSHRGMRLVPEATEVQGMVRCPYHSWTYDLQGCLRGTPHIGGVNQHSLTGFDRGAHGLAPVRSAVWMDMLFVNLSGTAAPFAEHIEPLQRRWHAFLGTEGLGHLRRVNQGGALEMTVTANWKLAVENYCEAYHLPWVHPSLNSYSRLEDHYTITGDGPFAGQGSLAYNLADQAGTQLPAFPEWPSDRLRQAEYVALYPNVLLGIQADHAFALMVEPLDHTHTREHLRIYYVGDEAAKDTYAANRTATLDSWRVVFQEDIAAVEGMQRGRHSPAFRGGVFSPAMDGPTHHFHKWVAERLLGDSGR